MKEIKSFFTNDIPIVPKAPKKSQQQRLPLQIGLDYCNRFRPLFDQDTFKSEFKDTNGEIMEYFEQRIRTQFQAFKDNSKYISIGSLALSLGFAMLCHRIGFLSKLLGQKSWKMFSFKAISLLTPYYVVEEIVLPEAENQELILLYGQVKDRYRRFKLNGDITELNPKIQLADPPLLGIERINILSQ